MLFSQEVKGQNFVFKRLKKVEVNTPEKLEVKAERYTKIFPKKPQAFYFLSKIQLEEFQNDTSAQNQYKLIRECLKYATKAQKNGLDTPFLESDDWKKLREEMKYVIYFYFQESPYSDKIGRLKEKYFLFLSNGERKLLLDSELSIQFPEEQKIDSLFYGLPTGDEKVPALFLEEEQKMLDLINKERKNLGLSEVTIDSALSRACRYHAYDMATQDYTSHFGYDLGTDGRVYFANQVFNRIRQFYNSSRVLNENISTGRKFASHTYKGWYNSPGHNKNLFNPTNNKVGIGLVYVENSEFKYYWVFNAAE